MVSNYQFIRFVLISVKGTEVSLLVSPTHKPLQPRASHSVFWTHVVFGYLQGSFCFCFCFLTEALFVLRLKHLFCGVLVPVYLLAATPRSNCASVFHWHQILWLPKWLVFFKDTSCLLAAIKSHIYLDKDHKVQHRGHMQQLMFIKPKAWSYLTRLHQLKINHTIFLKVPNISQNLKWTSLLTPKALTHPSCT